MDKLSDEKSGCESEKSVGSPPDPESPAMKIATVMVVAVVAIAAIVFYLQVMPGEESDPPSIDSWSIENNTRMPKLWINASDADDAISNITITIYLDTNPLGNPVFKKIYLVNNTTASITDTLSLNNLPQNDYKVIAYATDTLGKQSAFSGYRSITLPA